jgi:hypothetical protein
MIVGSDAMNLSLYSHLYFVSIAETQLIKDKNSEKNHLAKEHHRNLDALRKEHKKELDVSRNLG